MRLRLCRGLLAANAYYLIFGRTFFTFLMCEKGAFFVNICYYVASYKCVELEMHMKTKKYVEEVARNQLGLVYPDEIVIRPKE